MQNFSPLSLVLSENTFRKIFSDIADSVYPLHRKYAEYANILKAKQALLKSLLEEEKSKRELVDSIERLKLEVIDEQNKYDFIKEVVVEVKTFLYKLPADKEVESPRILSTPADALKSKPEEAYETTKAKVKELVTVYRLEEIRKY